MGAFGQGHARHSHVDRTGGVFVHNPHATYILTQLPNFEDGSTVASARSE
jgi:hypothetical protein